MKSKTILSLQWVVILVVTGIFAVSCASTNFNTVIGKDWRLVEVQTPAGPTEFSRDVLEAEDMGDYYTLRFDEERLSGIGAPNRYFAPYQLGEGKTISIQGIAGTLMASFKEPPGLGESDYYHNLGQVSRWELIDDTLNLYTVNSAGESLILVYR
jgi:heat shock protein HslJ